jgi:hypothetical protein
MADNSNRAGRECREHMREMSRKREALFDALDSYFYDTDQNLDEVEDWISTYLGKEWRKRKEWKIKKRKENAYNLRKNGIMRLRKMPVGSPERSYWYETGDGRVNAMAPKGKLSLGYGKYEPRLGMGTPKRKFRYV